MLESLVLYRVMRLGLVRKSTFHRKSDPDPWLEQENPARYVAGFLPGDFVLQIQQPVVGDALRLDNPHRLFGCAS